MLGTPQSRAQGAAVSNTICRLVQLRDGMGSAGEGTQQQSMPWWSLSELLLLRVEQQHHSGAVSEPSRMCLAADNGAELFVSDPTEVWS